MSQAIITEAVEAAGGQARVASECGIKQPSVFKWTRKGLPRTEWTGETNYSAVIARLCKENGYPEYTRDRLLNREGAAA